MKLHQLFEMPALSIKKIGDGKDQAKSYEDGLSSIDRRLLSNGDRYIKVLKGMPDCHLLILDTDLVKSLRYTRGKTSDGIIEKRRSNIRMRLYDIFEDTDGNTKDSPIINDIEDEIQDLHDKSDSLVIVYVGNYGTDKVALTPWILAHRFCSHMYE